MSSDVGEALTGVYRILKAADHESGDMQIAVNISSGTNTRLSHINVTRDPQRRQTELLFAGGLGVGF